MVKKGSEIKWDEEPRTTFQKIKHAIKDAPILRAPNYDKPMHIFYFSSFHTIATILLQKNEVDMNNLYHSLANPCRKKN